MGFETRGKTTFFVGVDGATYVVAFVRYVSPYGVSPSGSLVIDECPLCGGYHRHGATQQLGNNYGARSPHCYEQSSEKRKAWCEMHTEITEYANADYLLVDESYKPQATHTAAPATTDAANAHSDHENEGNEE